MMSSRLNKLLIGFLLLPIHGYRLLISPWLGVNCRFQPTCSAYALDAIRLHGPLKGGYLSARRIMRCHPGGGSGYDPVPASDADANADNASAKKVPLEND